MGQQQDNDSFTASLEGYEVRVSGRWQRGPWGGRIVPLGEFWRVPYGPTQLGNNLKLVGDTLLVSPAMANALAPPRGACDLCPAVFAVEYQDGVFLCQDCRPGHVVPVPRGPLWLRFLRWLASL